MPTIDYKNKTWSNLDMALHLKKDVIRILLQHTGSLIQNKLIKHRKKRFNQPLRQITNYASFTAIQDLAEAEVASSSTYNSGANIPRIQISGDDSPTGPVKPSLQSRNSTLSLDKKSFRFNLSPSVSRAESVKTLGSSNYNDDKIKSEDSLDGSGSISSSSNSPLKKLKNLSTTTSNSGSNKNDEDSHKKSGFLHKLLN